MNSRVLPSARSTAATRRGNPLQRGWRAVQRWWMARQPGGDTVTLHHRNLYILPTRPGLMLAATLLVLLVGSINYQLNLGYLLTFLLAGSAVVGMHVGHNNLRGLSLQVRPGDPVFAGQAARVDVVMHNPGKRPRYAVALRWREDPEATSMATSEAATKATRKAKAQAAKEAKSTAGHHDGWVWANVEARASETVQLGLPTQRRGRLSLPALSTETRFPLGAFRVWSWWRPAGEVLVYPAPETPAPPLPIGLAHESEEQPRSAPAAARQSDEYDGIRPYRRGDPLKWVVWKKAAKAWAQPGSPWVSRDFSSPQSAELWLDASLCGGLGVEARLSRLCAWVLQAEEAGLDYGLRLPGQQIPPDHGPHHQKRCLEALALC